MSQRDVLVVRADVAMWGAIAAAGPWLIDGRTAVGMFAAAAWLVAKLQEWKR